MKMCMHFKLIGKMGAGAEQEYTMDKEKKILNQIQPVSCPAPISLYFSAFLYISLHFSTFLCISLNVSAFRCISLHFSTFHFKRNLFHMKSAFIPWYCGWEFFTFTFIFWLGSIILFPYFQIFLCVLMNFVDITDVTLACLIGEDIKSLGFIILNHQWL